MLYIILIILILGTSGFLIFTYENKISSLKNDLIVLNSTINSLKSRIPNGDTQVKIDFKIPQSKMGVIRHNSMIYLSPDANSLIEKTSIYMEVRILDQAIYNGGTWFYVALPIDRSENSRGWVHKSTLPLLNKIFKAL